MNRAIKYLIGVSSTATLLMSPIVANAVCSPNMVPSTPNDRFEVVLDANNDSTGVVRDLVTGLMWTRCPVGFSVVSSRCDVDNASDSATYLFNFEQALTKANTAVLGMTGWRVPNLKDLNSIVETACTNPAMNTDVFPLSSESNSAIVWSSSPLDVSSGKVWAISYGLGGLGSTNVGDPAYLRLVRDDDTL